MKKIIYKVASILDASESVICHGCNAKGKMGAGVALQIARRWPEVKDIYVKFYRQFGLTLGTNITVDVASPNITVVNMIIQENYGSSNGFSKNHNIVYVDYYALRKCFEKLNDIVDPNSITPVAMPKIGAGLANGDWSQISSIIEENAIRYQPVVYVLLKEDIPGLVID